MYSDAKIAQKIELDSGSGGARLEPGSANVLPVCLNALPVALRVE